MKSLLLITLILWTQKACVTEKQLKKEKPLNYFTTPYTLDPDARYVSDYCKANPDAKACQCIS
jgi:hypothetical protein